MKRMYVTLAVMVLLVVGAGTLLAQNISVTKDERTPPSMEERFKMREKMHRRMMEKLLHGVGPDQDMFKDMEQFLDEVMSDSFSGHESFTRTTAQNYKMEWSESAKGRTLVITPQSPDQQLDINVSNGFIQIKGKTELRTSSGSSVSNFSNSFNVPGDCDPTNVKIDQKNGKILVFFPFKSGTPTKVDLNQKRRPLAPSDSDIQI